MKEQLLILDAGNLIHRAYHARFPPISCPCTDCDPSITTCPTCLNTGLEPTKVPYVITKQLMKLSREVKPSYLAIAFDTNRQTLHRKKIYPLYKEGRPDTPADFAPQLRRTRQIISALGICSLSVSGHEADDIIATLATKCVSDDVHVTIYTRDNDLEVLCQDRRIRLYDPLADEFADYDSIVKKRGLRPALLPVAKAVSGESGDGIPGVPGIGPVTAAKLVVQYNSVEEIIAHRNDLSPRLSAAIGKMQDQIRINRQLVELNRDVPLEVDPDALIHNGLNLEAARPIFRQLRFSRWGD